MTRYVMRSGETLESRESRRHRGRYILRDETRITRGLYFPVGKRAALRVERMIKCGTVGKYRRLWSDLYDGLTSSLDRDIKHQWKQGYVRVDGRRFGDVYNK